GLAVGSSTFQCIAATCQRRQSYGNRSIERNCRDILTLRILAIAASGDMLIY
ncbi:hypothetical protein ACJX0J_026221, partial [Zea mays]